MNPDRIIDKDPFQSLIRLIDHLRGKNGCPWDRKQTPKSMTVYLIEEVYELLEAIEAGDSGAICEELGDVLFHIFLISQMYREKGKFDISDVTSAITRKMIHRHPHVFGDVSVNSVDEVRQRWHQLKKKEKKDAGSTSMLDSIPANLPALARAYRISERVSRVGFDWDNLQGVMKKAEEEWHEFKEEVNGKGSASEPSKGMELEFGDILFTLVNVARLARLHPETALSASTHKFQKRFRSMEDRFAGQGVSLEDADMEEMDRIWEDVKRQADL